MASSKIKLVVGFKDEAALVWAIAKRLHATPHLAHESKYPAGEIALRGPAKVSGRALVVANIDEEPSHLFRALLLAAALREAGAKTVDLVSPWIAYGRQDRVTQAGESPAGIVIAHALAATFDRIVTLDAHSPLFIRAFRSKLINVLSVPPLAMKNQVDVIVAPDAGAEARAKHVARILGLPCVVMEKRRLGNRVIAKLHQEKRQPIVLAEKRALLVDDMADSGHTLLAATHTLKQAGVRSVAAFVTHAFDALKLRHRLLPSIDQVLIVFDHAKREIEPSALQSLADAL